MKWGKGMQEKLTIGKFEYNVREEELLHSDLKFYSENPRVYSVLNVANGMPDQDSIEVVMTGLEHVKQLKESIKANGGLIDPLIVRDGDFVVLEGNSRLAAYRILQKQDPIKWAKVKCKILPSDIDDKAIFTLLGQYHIIGRKDWSPYEQAGYLYRRTQKSKQPVDYIAEELGITLLKAKKFIEVYEFMIKHNDVHADKWSYYDELLKSKPINNYLKTVAGLEDAIVNQIKKGEIKQAVDIRNKLGGIAKVGGKTTNRVMKEIAEEKIDIYDGYEHVEDSGKTGSVYQNLNKFRKRITEESFKDKIRNEDTKQIKFELSKIKKTVDELLKDFE